MSVETLPQKADPTIEQLFEAFLSEQRKRLKPNIVAKYGNVISLL